MTATDFRSMQHPVPVNRSNVFVERADAEKALLALYPILDALAEVPQNFAAQKRGNPHKIDQVRWHFYRVAQVLNMGVHLWPHEPRRTISIEDEFGSYEASPGRWVCGVKTKKGTPCKRRIRWGRLACIQHATATEMEIARQYQEAIHLPFPRVGTGDIEKARANRQRLVESLIKELRAVEV